MRELKFRAFDTENKTWAFVTLGDLICGACTENGDKPLSGAKQVWEQYTGLKDKNGKEIYEGDIVFDKENKVRSKIVWNEQNLWFDNEAQPDEWGLSPYTEMLTQKTAKDFEVIGNIHENPELLEGEK